MLKENKNFYKYIVNIPPQNYIMSTCFGDPLQDFLKLHMFYLSSFV